MLFSMDPSMGPHLLTFDYDKRRHSIEEILDCRRIRRAIKRIRDIRLASASSPLASSAPSARTLQCCSHAESGLPFYEGA